LFRSPCTGLWCLSVTTTSTTSWVPTLSVGTAGAGWEMVWFASWARQTAGESRAATVVASGSARQASEPGSTAQGMGSLRDDQYSDSPEPPKEFAMILYLENSFYHPNDQISGQVNEEFARSQANPISVNADALFDEYKSWKRELSPVNGRLRFSRPTDL
jgi:hypothetical protein